MHEPSSPTGLEIAIIGMAGRFPGARDLAELWRNLRNKVESITFFTDEELAAAGVGPRDLQDPEYVKASPILDDVEHFAASFFGYSPREARLLDPQQRLFLECAWEAFENAGYQPASVPGPVGVYAGSGASKYLLHHLLFNPAVEWGFHIELSNDKDYLATRVSYNLGLQGPSVNVETACSTSLVAVHLACQALIAGECDLAVAGGIQMDLPQKKGYRYREGGHLSLDGHCRSFDARASGTNFGSGLGAVVLRRLEDAVADGDRIRAVIRGSAINNDGSAKVGFSAPSVEGQERVIRMAQAAAEVTPETITCIEAHGTATAIGDPIEVSALSQVFRAGTSRKNFCALGSVKSNIGHLGAAAGVTGLIKTTMALEHREILPSLLFERPNPEIDFDNSPFYVPTEPRPWKTNGAPRRAGVSAFGMGGTNAHVIVEEAPERAPSGPSRAWQLMLLSAETESALETLTARLVEHLSTHPEVDFADAAFTLKVGRKEWGHRRMAVCGDAEDAVATLGSLDPRRVLTATAGSARSPVVFLFSGQGAQHPRMASELMRAEPTFRRWIDRCAELLAPHLDVDLRVLLAGGENGAEAVDLDQTRLAQPALFAVEYALARLWQEWGVRPEAMIGHSIGEYVAACLAGVMSLEDALALVAARGRLMQGLPAGDMLSVPLAAAEIEPLLDARLSLAASNGPRRSVVSGPREAVRSLRRKLAEQGVDGRELHTSHAFHSAMMEPILAPFLEAVKKVALAPPQIPYVSNVTGTWIRETEATDPGYWVRHLRGTVLFADGLETLFEEPERIFLEVGPGRTLSSLCQQHPGRGAGHLVLSSLPHPRDRQPETQFLLTSLGRLWLAGAAVDWGGFYAHERRGRVPLPTYPFERRRYWIDPSENRMLPGTGSGNLSKKPDVADWFYLPFWKPSALPATRELAAESRWLIFLDPCGLGEAIARRVESAGARAITVRPGERFSRTEAGYVVRPAERADYEAMLADLAETEQIPGRILHLWSVTPAAADVTDRAAAERLLDLGFYSLLSLAQALGHHGVMDPIGLGIVANGLARVDGGESLWPEKAAVLGPGKTLPLEYPNLRCSTIDVALPAAGDLEPLAVLLVNELVAEPADALLAYRRGSRWVQGYEPVRLDEPADRRLPLRTGGVYLITGGLGGLGLEFARYLARGFEAKMVLIGRTPLPARADWESWLDTHDAEDAVGRKIRQLLDLEKAGAEVLALSADVTAIESMREVLDQARRRFGRVRGVIHAAGLPGGGVIQRKTRETAAGVLAPKVRGTRVLEEVLAGEPLDFIMLCSSLTAVVSTFGQVDYCAANNVLDVFAHRWAEKGFAEVSVSVNWGAWEEVGMAVETEPLRGARAPAEAGHPLLGRCVAETPERSVFSAELRATDQWVLAEHKVFDAPTVPGTTYLEMARAAFETRTGEAGVEISEVLFSTPLRIDDGAAREVRTLLETNGDAFDFRVSSRRPSDGDESWQEHVRGRVGPLATQPSPRRYELDEVVARCDAESVEIEQEMHPEGSPIFWGPRWQSLRRVCIGADQGVADVELPREFVADLETMALHPALFDVATSLSVHGAGGVYLPLSYRRIRVRRPLPARFYAYLRRQPSRSSTQETVSADVVFFDEDGAELVAIEEFTQKRVPRDRAGQAAERPRQSGVETASATSDAAVSSGQSDADSSPPGPTPAGPRRGPLAGGGISPGEGIEAFRRLLSRQRSAQVVVSCKDLPTLLAGTRAQDRLRELQEAESPARRASHPRPNLPNAYVAPTNDLEAALAELWQELLGIAEVGIHDNFYELGGDSILGIQVVAKAKQRDLVFSPSQLFENLTIAELAAALAEETEAEPSAPRAGSESGSVKEAFSELQIDRPRLDKLIAGQGAVADVYPLTPLQQGFLLHSLESPEAGLYLEVISVPLDGPFDETAFVRAWQRVIDRHPVLRTAFFWQRLDEPLQVVFEQVRLPYACIDWRRLSAERQQTRLEDFTRAEAKRGFELGRAPLLRLSLIRLAEETYHLVWTHHHLLMDGWASTLVSREVLQLYEAFRRGERPRLERPRPFRDFVAWLRRQDFSAAERYWRQRLAGFARPNSLRAREAAGEEARLDQREIVLPRETTRALQTLAQRRKVTLNTVVQGAWALLLSRWSGDRDVVYGVTVSGRPPELDGVEAMVGVFINTLPMRLEVDPDMSLADFWVEIRKRQTELLDRSHVPLAQVQAWSELRGGPPLFASIFHFWNFPGIPSRVEMRRFRYQVRTHYPLLVRAIPGEELVLELVFDPRRLNRVRIESLAEQFATVLTEMTEHAGARVGRFRDVLDKADTMARSSRARKISELARQKLASRTRDKAAATN